MSEKVTVIEVRSAVTASHFSDNYGVEHECAHEIYINGTKFPWDIKNAWVESRNFDGNPTVLIELAAGQVEMIRSQLDPALLPPPRHTPEGEATC